MHDAGLHYGLREHRRDRFREAFEPIDHRNENVVDAARLELVDDLEPELGAFGLLDPQPQNFLLAVGIECERHVDGLVLDQALIANLDPQGVEKHHRIDRIERPVLPLPNLVKDRIGWIGRWDELWPQPCGIPYAHSETGPRSLATGPAIGSPDQRGRSRMRRREFIAGLGIAAALPVVTRAQQGDRMLRIGVLIGGSKDDPVTKPRLAAFRQALVELGWAEGRNLRIDSRYASGDRALLPKYATELVGLKPDVILANGGGSVRPLEQASRTVPIVFAEVIDPVGGGYVESLALPGGNATGFTSFEYSFAGKWLELLKQIAPGVTRAAVLRDPAQFAGVAQLGVIQAVAPSHRVVVSPL